MSTNKTIFKMGVAALLLSTGGFAQTQQSKGVTVDLHSVDALSKWGRWASSSELKFSDRFNRGYTAQWQGDGWTFKLNRNEHGDLPELFFGLKVNEADFGVTSVGCMSQPATDGNFEAACGVQLDMSLK